MRCGFSLIFLFACTAARLCAGEDPNIAEVLDVPPPPSTALGEVIPVEAEPVVPETPDLPRANVTASEVPQHGAWIVLDGSLSNDPLRGELQYQWKQSAGPRLPFLPEELSKPQAWVYLAFAGQYRFTLKVKNAKGWSPSREVILDARENVGAMSLDEARKLAGAGEDVLLPGEGWRQVAGPGVTLRTSEKGQHFRAGLSGVYVFEAQGLTGRPERRGIVVPAGPDKVFGDRRPFARLPKNLAGVTGRTLVVNGGLSLDQDGPEETRKLTAKWTSPERFRGVEIEALSGLRAKFTAPRSGVYRLTLAVSDGRLESAPESVFIKIDNDAEATPQNNVIAVEDFVSYEKEDVLYRNVKLGLWGDLDRAVQMFPSRCGVALRVDADVSTPEGFKQIPLALEVQNNALVHLLTWTCRQTDTRFRRDGDRSLWLMKPMSWIRDEKLDTDAISIDALAGKSDASDLLDPLKAHFGPIVDATPGASMVHLDERAALQVFMPGSARARLREIILTLRAPEGLGFPPPDLPSPAEFNLRQMLGEKTVTLKSGRRRLDLLLRDLSEQSGLAAAMDPRQFPNGLPSVSVDIDGLLLRDAIRRIVEVGGFDGCSVEAPGGLWFYKGPEPYPIGELLWDVTQVRAYDLGKMVRALAPLSGEAIAHAIRSRVYPGSWSEPGALCFYHAKTRKLVVMHGPAAHQRVTEFLQDLMERKEWALGPVE